jgi:MFS family permease
MKSLTSHQRLVVIVAWLGWVFDVMEASLFALTKKSMLTEMLGAEGFKAQGAQIGANIHVAMLIGWSIGGLVFGIVADRWGRSKTLLLTVFLYCLFTGLTSLCQTPEQVMVARFLTGLGIGGEWAAGAALIAETVPNEFRSRAAAFLQTAAAIGSMIGVFVNVQFGSANWRWVYLVGIAPALLCFAARFKLEPDQPTQPIKREDPERPAGMPWKNLAVASLIGVVGITGGGLLPFWLPDLVGAIVPKSEEAYWKNLSIFVLHIGTLAGVLVFPPLTDRFGRRPMFAVFATLGGISLFATGMLAKSMASLLILAPLTSFFALGLTAGFGLYFPELFPRAFRATGSGVAYNLSRIFSAPFQALLGAMVVRFGITTSIGYAAMIYLLMFVGLAFAPETKGSVLDQPSEA